MKKILKIILVIIYLLAFAAFVFTQDFKSDIQKMNRSYECLEEFHASIQVEMFSGANSQAMHSVQAEINKKGTL